MYLKVQELMIEQLSGVRTVRMMNMHSDVLSNPLTQPVTRRINHGLVRTQHHGSSPREAFINNRLITSKPKLHIGSLNKLYTENNPGLIRVVTHQLRDARKMGGPPATGRRRCDRYVARYNSTIKRLWWWFEVLKKLLTSVMLGELDKLWFIFEMVHLQGFSEP